MVRASPRPVFALGGNDIARGGGDSAVRAGHDDVVAAHIRGMSTFNESDHPRGHAGKFTEKALVEADSVLDDLDRPEAQAVRRGDILRAPGEAQSWFGRAILHDKELRKRFSAAGMPHDFVVLDVQRTPTDDPSERDVSIVVDFDGESHTFHFHPETSVELGDRGSRPARPYVILQCADDDEFFDAPIGSTIDTEDGTFKQTGQWEWETPAGGETISAGELWQIIEDSRAKMNLPAGWQFSDQGWFRRSE